MDFAQDLQNYLTNPELFIAGGNDNSDCPQPFGGGELPFTDVDSPLVARKDGTYWTLYNRVTGTKIRFSFDVDPCDPSLGPVKSTVPETVDLKITECCHRGCFYCYQDSTPTGQHASMENITSLLYALEGLHVFEVVLGGGEPTLHPRFADILTACHAYHVAVSFTTGNLEWLNNPTIVDSVRKNCQSFAYSPASYQDLVDMYGALRAQGIEVGNNDLGHGNAKDIAIHLVPELLDESALEDYLRLAGDMNSRVTLLGLKRQGRAAHLPPYVRTTAAGTIFSVIRNFSKVNYTRIGIDSVLALSLAPHLLAAHISKTLYETTEGGFTCYVDAVKGRIAASSFAQTSYALPQYHSSAFKAGFAKIKPE